MTAGYPIDAEVVREAVSWRRQLHAQPELAFSEQATSQFIASRLVEFGLEVHRGLGGTGVVGTLRRGSSSRSIGIRADMDALPIQECSGVTHSSRVVGVMHACGHDGHTAITLGAARVCSQLPGLDGTVHFIFQPAEENEGGARRMMMDGLFRQFPCDAVYALHNWPTLPAGTCVVRDEAMMAALATFEIVVVGRGCHGAMPHEGSDCILAASHVIAGLQSIVSRNLDPLQSGLVSVTQIRAGDTWNVLPDSCTIRGTSRWFDAAVGDTLEQRIAELAQSIASGFGCRADVRYERRYPPTINHPESARWLRGVIRDCGLGIELVDARASMSSEDFSEMLQVVPGCYLWLGSGATGTDPGLHSPRYDFNDEVVHLGIGLWTAVVARVIGPTADS